MTMYCALVTVLVSLVGPVETSSAFVPVRSQAFSEKGLQGRTYFSNKPILTETARCRAHNSPTAEELATDGFMKQVSHSEKVVAMLQSADSDDEEITTLLKAQLGHSEGIRGFFVTYLTMDGDNTPADRPEVAPALMTAMKESSNQSELISLACMNVIMPTGMITMHKEETLSRQSQKTAERGQRVLRAIRSLPGVKEECDAIVAVASDCKDAAHADSSKIAYWKEFFDKWGYGDIQRHDIARAVRSVFAD